MKKIFLFDWGNTIMRNLPNESGKMNTWRKVEAMPNAEEMLKELNQNANCYLATNARDSFKEDIFEALKRAHLHKYFKDIFCFNEIGSLKPSLEYFDAIFRKLNVSKEEVVMIGDNLKNDVKGAEDYGFESILYDVNNKYPNYTGTRIVDLLEILKIFDQ